MKIRAILAIFILTCFCQPTFSQQCTPVYRNEYGGNGSDEALAIRSTVDGGSIVAGRTTSSSAGDYDGLVMKLSSTGAVEWSQNFGGTRFDEITSIIPLSTSGYLAGGFTRSFANPNGEPFIIRLNSSGGVIWSKTYISNSTQKHRLADLLELDDHTLVALINSNDSTSQGNAVAMKLDAGGSPLWSREFNYGAYDAFCAGSQKGDTILIGGFATTPSGNLAGTIVKLGINGQHYSTWMLQRSTPGFPEPAHDNRILMVAPCPEGIMFSQAVRYVNASNSEETGIWWLITAKHNAAGEKVWSQLNDLSTGFTDATRVYSRQGRDYSFLYSSGEGRSTNYTMPEIFNVGFTYNQTRLGRKVDKDNVYRRSFFAGIDTGAGNGYITAGYSKGDYLLTGPNRINVQKMDEMMRIGSCTGTRAIDFTFTAQYTAGSLSWSTVANSNITETDQNLLLAGNAIAQTASCADTYCPPTSSVADQCLASLSLNLRGERLTQVMDLSRSASGHYWAAGGYSEPGTMTGLVTNLNSDGSVNWSRQYSDNRFDSYVKRVIHNPDGTAILAMNHEGSIDHGGIAYVVISKVDAQGNLIWSQRYTNGDDLALYEIIPTGTGDYIFIANVGHGSGTVGNHLVRINGNGNVVWKNRMDHFARSAVGKALLLDGNDLYVSYDKYANISIVQVEKWNSQSGTREWSRSMDFSGADVALVHGIFQIGSTMWTAVQTHTGGIIQTHVFPIRPNGQLMTGITLVSPAMTYTNFTDAAFFNEQRPGYVTRTPDNCFVVAQQITINGALSLALIKYNSSMQLQWAKHFPDYNNHGVSSITTDGDNILLSGLIGKPDIDADPRVDRSFVISFNSMGEITSSGPACQSQSLPVTLVTIDPPFHPWDGPSDVNLPQYPLIESDAITIEQHPAYIYANVNCRQPSTCTSLAIQGTTNICDTSATYVFTADRNTGCDSPVLWDFDPAFAEKISSTDNTITLHFLEVTDNFLLKARLSSGCTSTNDELVVNIVKPAAAVTLGPDAVICPGNNLKLDAGTGYNSYVWNDGTTLQEITVTAPGTYYVDITDGCNNSSRASVVIGDAPPLVFSLGNDRTLCIGDTAVLRAPEGLETYNWSPLWNTSIPTASAVTVFPVHDTAYVLEATRADGCRGADTVYFSVSVPPAIDLGFDTSLCRNTQLVLDPGPGFASYYWNQQTGDRIKNVSTTGSYMIDAITADGCHSRDTLVVNSIHELPRPGLAAKTVICRGSAREIAASNGFTSYLWNTGANTPSISTTVPGLYSVIVTSSFGCHGYDTTLISDIIEPPSKFLGKDTAICSYGTISLKPSIDLSGYHWSSGGSSMVLEVNLPGMYWLSATDMNGCTGRDSVLVSLKDCMVGVYTPTAFTPNNDGNNDVFKPSVFGPVLQYSFKVFDRNGNLVFSTKDVNRGWNGLVAGVPHGNEVFVWMCEYQLPGETKKMEKGTVHLIR